jgi:hypothetical protein
MMFREMNIKIDIRRIVKESIFIAHPIKFEKLFLLIILVQVVVLHET